EPMTWSERLPQIGIVLPPAAKPVANYVPAVRAQRDAAIRADLRRFAAGVDNRVTQAAAERFGQVDVPVLVVWSTEDRLFPMTLAQRLVTALPKASLRTVDDSYTFLSEDRPELLAELIVEFTRLHAAP
ncbi:alpha/beta fold hydrolase, partial [Gordonia aichiensis]